MYLPRMRSTLSYCPWGYVTVMIRIPLYHHAPPPPRENHTHSDTHTHAHKHTRTHAHTHKHTPARTHTHTRTHNAHRHKNTTQMYTESNSPCVSWQVADDEQLCVPSAHSSMLEQSGLGRKPTRHGQMKLGISLTHVVEFSWCPRLVQLFGFRHSFKSSQRRRTHRICYIRTMKRTYPLQSNVTYPVASYPSTSVIQQAREW